MFLSRCAGTRRLPRSLIRTPGTHCRRHLGNNAVGDAGRVGFVGLGNMGSGMVKNLASKGFQVSIFDIDRTRLMATRDTILKENKLPATAIDVEDSLSSLAKKCGIVCVSLTNEEAGRKVFFGEGGLVGPGSTVHTVVDHSTVSCQFTKECHQQFKSSGVLYLDGPVSGGPEGAAKGTLSIMIGAPSSTDFEAVRPVLEAMGGFVRCMGPSGTGTAAKLINQLLTGVHIVAACEGYVLAKTLGIDDTSSMLELLSRSWGNSTMLQRCGSKLIKVEQAASGLDILSTSGAPIRNFNKDFKTIESAAAMAGLDLPLTDRARAQIDKAMGMGLGEWDIAAMVRVVEQRKK